MVGAILMMRVLFNPFALVSRFEMIESLRGGGGNDGGTEGIVIDALALAGPARTLGSSMAAWI